MHIALLTKGGKWWLGGGQYIKNIAYALNTLPPETRSKLRISLIATAGTDINTFTELEGTVDAIIDGEAISKPYNLINRARWKVKRSISTSTNPRLEELLRSEGVDFAYPCRPNKALLPGLRFADWIPDFQYDYFPEGSNPEEIEGRKAEWAYVTENVPRIVLSSAEAEKDCLRLFPAAAGKTFVLRFRVWFPVEYLRWEVAPVIREYNLPEQFFLVSNLFAPTKNHRTIFEALKLLRAEGLSPTVVCTGDLHDYRNPDFVNSILSSVNQNGVSGQVKLLGIIPRGQQVQLMRHAIAVLQPSFFEGWNTSVEEAHCLGKQLLLSDIPVHREQNPPNAIFFDPHSSATLALAMRRALAENSGGSDVAREDSSVAKYKSLVQEFGRTFLKLAAMDKDEPRARRHAGAPGEAAGENTALTLNSKGKNSEIHPSN
jgi:glycosyltransferase involved in cell wall biosynthesis